MQIQTIYREKDKKMKGPEVVLIVIPIVSMVGEDALNQSLRWSRRVTHAN